ncbi:MAG: helix-turn-helix transcriptional regulator [Egibacteraceae bacterium]
MAGETRASSPILVGRREELSRLEALLDGARSGRAATVLIAGEAGIGKTRVVSELAQRATAVGAMVLSGACIDLGEEVLPYAPFVELLHSVTRREGLALVLELAGSTGDELSRLLPALGGVGGPPEVSRAGASRLYLALTSLFEGLARRRPLVLVVDDVHWADRSTRDMLAVLAHTLRGRSLLVLTYRTDEVRDDAALRRFTLQLERSSAYRLTLDALSRDDQARQLSGILGVPPATSLLDQIYARAEGNPFFAEELLALGATGTVPTGVRQLMLARLDALPPATQVVLRAAATAGRRVSHALLATITGMSGDALDEALRPAVTSYVLLADGVDGGSYRFRHELLREAIAATVLPGEAVRLHRALAEELGRQPAGTQGRRGAAGRLAHHWHAAGDKARALTASIAAAEEAGQALAFTEALTHYDRAIALFDDVAGTDELLSRPRYQVLWSAAESAHLAAFPQRAADLVRAAIAAVDDDQPLHRAYLHERLGRYLWMAADGQGAMAAYQRAMQLAPVDPPSCWRAAIVSGYAQILMLAGRCSESRAYCEEAIRVAQHVEKGRSTEGHARNTLGVDLAFLGDLDAGIAHLREARRIAEEEFDDVDDIGRAIVNLDSILLDAGRHQEAAQGALDGIGVIDRLGLQCRKGVWCRCDAIDALLALGRWAEAERLSDEALGLSPEGIDALRVMQTRGLLRLRRGELAEARRHLVDAHSRGRRVIDGQINGPLFTGLVELASWDGNPEEALAVAQEGAGRLRDDEDATHCVPLFAAATRASADAAQRLRARDPAAAQRTVTTAAAWVDRAEAAVTRDRAAKRPAAAYLRMAHAELARARDAQGAAAVWRDAAMAWHDLGDPWRLAYCRWREAEAWLVEGGAREEATIAAQSAAEAVSRLGARTLEAAIRDLARRARLRLHGEHDGRPDQGNPFRLTAREREVLELVADGRTDRQIGKQLFISHRTVERHVSNILAKVGAVRRAEVAAVAHRSGLLELAHDR